MIKKYSENRENGADKRTLFEGFLLVARIRRLTDRYLPAHTAASPVTSI